MSLGTARWPDSVRHWLATGRFTPSRPESTWPVEGIRQAMLDTLGNGSASPSHGELRVQSRIRRCQGVPDLWYLRSELMQLLCARLGEREAGRRLAQISGLFEGAFPSAPSSRHGPGGDGRPSGQAHD